MGSSTERYPPEKVVFCPALDATCHSMNGIRQPLLNTTKATYVVQNKPLTALSLNDKTVYYSPCTKIQKNQTFTHLNTKTPILLVFPCLCSKTLCNPFVPPEASASQFKHGLPPESTVDSLHRLIKLDKAINDPPCQPNIFLTVCFIL